MILCERVVDTTQQQQATLGYIEQTMSKALTVLRQQYPHDPVWKKATTEWRGRVYLGSRLHVAEYQRSTGCLTIGLDTNGSQDARALLFTRCFLRLVKETTGSTRCTESMLVALDTCRDHGIEIDLRCDDIKEMSLINTPYYDDKQCGEAHQDGRQWTFPELIGRDIDDAVNMLRAGYPDLAIKTMAWDTMHTQGSHGNPNQTVIIVYDPWSRKVVYPEPHIQSTGPQESLTENCFMVADDGTCRGAPRRIPETWRTLIGKSLGDATNSLRWEYPHAVVETSPDTAAIDPVRRRDRIRVLFDPETGATTRLMLG
jgi:hypothetical protein